MKQLGALVVFLGMQLLEVCEWIIKREERRTKEKFNFYEVQVLRMKVFAAVGAAGIVLLSIFMPAGYFGPLSSRVRGLFVQHTRTGNPLVDSVAEHQPATADAYLSLSSLYLLLWPSRICDLMLPKSDSGIIFGVLRNYRILFLHKNEPTYYTAWTNRLRTRRYSGFWYGQLVY